MNGKAAKPSSGDNIYLFALFIVLLFIAFVRWRLFSMPLERDEGEYAYVGKLILQGVPPYKESYNMKLPGTYYMYALLMALFGKTITGVHLGMLLVNVLTIVIFFLGFKKIFNSSIAFFAAAAYGLMSLSPNLQGFAAHATHFINFFVSLGIYGFACFMQKDTVRNAFLTGIMFGLAFLMKQQAIFFIFFGGIMLLVQKIHEKKQIFKIILAYAVGIVIPYFIVLLIVYIAGAQNRFWFWTFEYAIKYATGGSDAKALFVMSFQPMWTEYMILWLLALVGLVITFISKFNTLQKTFIIAFALLAFFSICPGFYFRPHYFITLLPAVCLLASVGIHIALSRLKKIGAVMTIQFLLLLLVSLNAVSKNMDYYLNATPRELSKSLYGTNPFVESTEIAKYIQANTNANDKIAVLGSEPELLFYSNRRSATGYIYTYSLMEPQAFNLRMQKEMIAEIEKAKPKFIVFYRVNFSWLIRPNSPKDIMKWAVDYTDKLYNLDGVAEVWGIDEYNYKWGKEAENYKPASPDYVLIFRRNN
jgi:4-amino-4-deoxy-L-arabinose transferase-like glycosyltransferase